MRERLPDRRNAEVIDFVHLKRRWTATIGRFPDGRVAELFLDGEKVDPLSELAQDVAIVASIALQSGTSLSTLRHALAGRGEGPLSAVLNLIEERPSAFRAEASG
jgi:ribonucleoside-diphosphate reductase alpha chain